MYARKEYAPVDSVMRLAAILFVTPLVACSYGVTHHCAAPTTTQAHYQSIAVSSHGGCALDSNSQLTCWGAEKPNGEGPHCPVSQRIIGKHRKVVATEHAVCALDASGWILCAGPPRNYVWLGDAYSQASRLYAEERFVDVAVGPLGVCGVTVENTLRCAARDYWGAWLETEQSVKSVSIGDAHACILHQNGTVRCRGYYTDIGATRGDLRRDKALELEERGSVLALGAKAVSVHSGSYHACAVTEAGDLWCWGANHHGQVRAVTSRTTEPAHLLRRPVKITLPGRVKSVALGGASSCALLRDGGVYCWGFGEDGVLGVGEDGRHTPGTRGSVLRPKRVPLASPATAIAMGANACNPQICATLNSGQLTCWGNDAAKPDEPGAFVRREGLSLGGPAIEFADWQRAPDAEYEWDPYQYVQVRPLDRCVDARTLRYSRSRVPLPQCSPLMDTGLDADEVTPAQLQGRYAVATGKFKRYCTGTTKGDPPMCAGMFATLGELHFEAAQLRCGQPISFDAAYVRSCNVDGAARALTMGGVFDGRLVTEWVCQHD